VGRGNLQQDGQRGDAGPGRVGAHAAQRPLPGSEPLTSPGLSAIMATVESGRQLSLSFTMGGHLWPKHPEWSSPIWTQRA
jgi:hypothetical protein